MEIVCLIVDDEELSRNYIYDLIKEFEPEAIVLEAPSANVARSYIENGTIDILFLDIKMDEADGFDLLASLPGHNFELVFITAFSQYAIQAIKEGACDYLLKPVKKRDFKLTLQKVIERRKQTLIQIQHLAESASNNYLNNKLAINQQQGTKFVTIKDIIYLAADNTYTTIHLYNGAKITTSKPISRFEQTLDHKWFFRIHKSYIINSYHFKEHISLDRDVAVMNNGERLIISRHRKNQFVDFISHGLKI